MLEPLRSRRRFIVAPVAAQLAAAAACTRTPEELLISETTGTTGTTGTRTRTARDQVGESVHVRVCGRTM